MKKVLVPLNVLRVLPDMIYPLHFAQETYITKLSKNNLIPLFVSPAMNKDIIQELYKISDGAFFIGGSDINPSLYGEKKHPETEVLEPERDVLELTLLKKILSDKKPFLGVCRGAQMLAVAAGGKLHQHIPDITSTEIHGPGTLEGYDSLHKIGKIPVKINNRSKVYTIIGVDEITVNCSHHQATDPNRNLVISGITTAGIAEIVEHSDPDYFCIGVQSHPETEEHNFFDNILVTFAEAVNRY